MNLITGNGIAKRDPVLHYSDGPNLNPYRDWGGTHVTLCGHGAVTADTAQRKEGRRCKPCARLKRQRREPRRTAKRHPKPKGTWGLVK